MATKKPPKRKRAPQGQRRRPNCRKQAVQILADLEDRESALRQLSAKDLKELLRGARIGIPKQKDEMVLRLAAEPDVVICGTIEFVTFPAKR